ncbi:MAG: valine--tRNA ligase [Rhodobacteraceae bacterium]|nr:valine--tRNA ligase [Paracoccaceae bacterium]
MEPKFDAGKIESRIYARWETQGHFKAGANAKPDAETFCILIPPPNVTGALHMGHAFNNTIQDILIRWHRMQGDDVLWQPGMDHAGIATQMVVERRLEEQGEPDRRELGREEFLRRVWTWKNQSGGEIIRQLKQLGTSCDWSRSRFTMDKGFHDAVLKVFVELYNQGFIYRGKRLVNWDPHFETAISDLEVEQVEVEGTMWHFRYQLADGARYEHPLAEEAGGQPVGTETRGYLVVATTRPETLLGDTGVAVHPEDPRYQHLIGQSVILPLTRRRIPIVADTHADPTKGTGAVKITPAHDFNDWSVGERCGLPAINIMTGRATLALRNNAEFLEGCDVLPEALNLDGLDRYEARKRIVELAGEGGWLDAAVDDSHTVPHGDRSKVAIEPFLTDQWFVDTRAIVGPALDSVRSGRTRILPEQYEQTYFQWLENIEPWCISRQLWWGHQIPVWYDEDGRQYCATGEAEARALAGNRILVRDQDVLDTWFSSGLWPIGTLGWPDSTPEMERYFPTDVLVTGFDIIFFWVARMMMMQLAIVGEIPFHTVYVHALVRDEHGKKMSKSIGNVVDPLELTERYGADALRFTLTSMAAMGRDLRLAENRVAGSRNFVTKIWNAARFLKINDCQKETMPDPADVTHPINRWIIAHTARTAHATNDSFATYRFNDAANGLYDFFWNRFCDWYIEFSKSLTAEKDSDLAGETRATLLWTLKQSMLLLHPVMPFITEEIWQELQLGTKDLIIADWPDLDPAEYCDPATEAEIDWLVALIGAIRSTRSQLRVPAGSTIGLTALRIDDRGRRILVEHSEQIGRLGRISGWSESRNRPAEAATLMVGDCEFCLELAGVINLDDERARLAGDIAALGRECTEMEARLANPRFVTRAPAEVVEKVREQLRGKQVEIDAKSGALANLKG